MIWSGARRAFVVFGALGAEKSKGNSFFCLHISGSSASAAVNTSAPFIRRPVGTALLTVAVASKEEEFLAEKWGQKDKKKIDFSVPIFLPFPPALLLQGHRAPEKTQTSSSNPLLLKMLGAWIRSVQPAADNRLSMVCGFGAWSFPEAWGLKLGVWIHPKPRSRRP